ncbi:transmembrane emp24 domain-containing protein p24delta9-like [Phoenix dactylifera]|uniref:Transmembrane emp24 domain-containing protein p24delta9-like n=1 Tax=Phoenix dactylifera TaxID=42345 RepID=A0A8B9A193_PHODC|nr:transmembrane emp24 domain-containing protein p24delta9-like [Phoenix dactylifera]XP_038980365.1 transmembrane emp24 domain-containing protein p24delta9-like [Phoenix dactylifera]
MDSIQFLPPFLLILLNFSLLPATPLALVFHIPSGRIKCLTEDLAAGALSVAQFRVADDPPSAHKISASVSAPNGEIVHHSESVESGQFAFEAGIAGRYTACFWSPKFRLDAAVSLDFEWKTGVFAKVWTSVAKKEKIDVMELELKKLELIIDSIHEEMIYLRQREAETQRLNQSITSGMGLLSLLSLIVCLGVAGLQLWHLKTYFEREKIL